LEKGEGFQKNDVGKHLVLSDLKALRFGRGEAGKEVWQEKFSVQATWGKATPFKATNGTEG